MLSGTYVGIAPGEGEETRRGPTTVVEEEEPTEPATRGAPREQPRKRQVGL